MHQIFIIINIIANIVLKFKFQISWIIAAFIKREQNPNYSNVLVINSQKFMTKALERISFYLISYAS